MPRPATLFRMPRPPQPHRSPPIRSAASGPRGPAGRSTAWTPSSTPWCWCPRCAICCRAPASPPPGEHRLLRRPPVRDLPGRLGLRVPLGSGRRPLRPRPHAGAHHPLLLALHLPRLRRRERLATRRCSAFSPASGIGGEWTLGGVFVAEEWPEVAPRSRARPGCTPATISASFLAAIVNYTIGAHYGWRAVFAVGGAPALLVAFIRYGVREPERWQHRAREARPQMDRARRLLRARSPPEYRRRTIVNAALLLRLHGRAVGGLGLRAVVGHVPRDARRLHAPRKPRASLPGRRCCSPSGTILGCLALPCARRRGSDAAARSASTSC